MFSLADRSLYIEALDLWLDSLRPRTRCYVSHGHSDHARAHATVVTTPQSAAICRWRFGRRTDENVAECDFEERPYNEPWDDGEHRLTLFSAGHVLGSAQLLVEGAAGRFVYTGDFKLGRAYTCAPAEVKRCDVVLMECTYGRDRYVFPPRDEVESHIVEFAVRALEDGVAPVFLAYSLGKAQEALAILGKAGLPLTVHGAVAGINTVYETCGVTLPPWERYDALTYDGSRVLIWPPGKTFPKALRERPSRSAMLSGWSLDSGAIYRYGTDAAFVLSDHADFPSLVRYVELAQPKKVLLNHGWRTFVHHLRKLGVDAEYLEANAQLALF